MMRCKRCRSTEIEEVGYDLSAAEWLELHQVDSLASMNEAVRVWESEGGLSKTGLTRRQIREAQRLTSSNARQRAVLMQVRKSYRRPPAQL